MYGAALYNAGDDNHPVERGSIEFNDEAALTTIAHL